MKYSEAQLRGIFEEMDKDKNGIIDISELKSMLKTIDQTTVISNEEVLVFMRQNVHKDTLTFEDFSKIMENLSSGSEMINQLKKVFYKVSECSEGGNTVLVLEKFKIFIRNVPGMPSMSNEEIERLFNKIDTDKNGSISFEEFVNFQKNQFKE